MRQRNALRNLTKNLEGFLNKVKPVSSSVSRSEQFTLHLGNAV